MTKVFAVRRDNLRRLSEAYGGAAKLAKPLGHTNGSRISQLIGKGATDEISERKARSIERTLELPEGYLDQDIAAAGSATLSGCVAKSVKDLVELIGDDSLAAMSEDRFGTLCAMVLHECRATGHADPAFVRRLGRLLAAD
jgi:hypothetical protein